jgi:amidophosphoribosyltransferase
MPVKPSIHLPYERLKPDDDCMHEECGVFGVYREDEFFDAAETVYFGLYALQHRGQESAGIAVSDGKDINYKKNMGLVTEVFKDGIDELTKARIAMGHVRYSTTGESHLYNAQPLVITSKTGKIALAHNGNLVNAARLRSELENDGAIFQTTIDSEIIASLIARNSQNGILPARFMVLTALNIPAVLIEMGFITSAADKERLIRPGAAYPLAAAIAAGVCAFAAGEEPAAPALSPFLTPAGDDPDEQISPGG